MRFQESDCEVVERLESNYNNDIIFKRGEANSSNNLAFPRKDEGIKNTLPRFDFNAKYIG